MTRPAITRPAFFLSVALLAAPVSALAAGASSVRFEDVSASSGIDFVHYDGATADKFMVETMGSGGGFLDYDGDGDLDVYLLNGAPLPGSAEYETPPLNRLYRNDSGRFVDVTAAAGVGQDGYGMGLTAADVDNDGDVDLYVTNFGDNVLYRNEGDGTFTDVTAAAGVAAGGWSTSAAFADFDADGYVDLFVCRYVDFSVDNHVFCGDLAKGIRAYCHPDVYDPVPSLLFKNDGSGRFTEVSAAAGVSTPGEGKSLGVVWTDYDDDGDSDLYVANDSMRNFLFRNDGNGTFTDVTLLAGVGYSEDGDTQAGMGTDAADYDANGHVDLFVTNLDFEYNALYRGGADRMFSDRSFDVGVAEPSLSFVGFGTFFFDFDNDGELDLFVANGHIIDNIHLFKTSTYEQRNFVFRNLGDGRFAEVGAELGSALREPNVARGAVAADYDRDGDEDVLVTRVGGPPALLRNDGGNAAGWLAVTLVGRESSRDGIGARITVETPRGLRFKEVKSGLSYLSQGALEVHFGLADAEAASRLVVRWPSGATDALGPVPSGSRITVVEGLGEP